MESRFRASWPSVALAELARHSTRTVRLADVEKVVCDVFGVEPAQLRSDRKGRSR